MVSFCVTLSTSPIKDILSLPAKSTKNILDTVAVLWVFSLGVNSTYKLKIQWEREEAWFI